MGAALITSVMTMLGVVLGVALNERFRRRSAKEEAESARAGRVATAVGNLCSASIAAVYDLQLAPHLKRREMPDLIERLKAVQPPYLAITLEADAETARLAGVVLDCMGELAAMTDGQRPDPVVWEAARTRLGKAAFALRNQSRAQAGLDALPPPSD